MHGFENVVFHVAYHAGGHESVGATLHNANEHAKERHAQQNAYPNIHIFQLVHRAVGVNDLVIEDLTADNGVSKLRVVLPSRQRSTTTSWGVNSLK